eukprot:762890-Pleurochrysis_carterae.AAC.6
MSSQKAPSVPTALSAELRPMFAQWEKWSLELSPPAAFVHGAPPARPEHKDETGAKSSARKAQQPSAGQGQQQDALPAQHVLNVRCSMRRVGDGWIHMHDFAEQACMRSSICYLTLRAACNSERQRSHRSHNYLRTYTFPSVTAHRDLT